MRTILTGFQSIFLLILVGCVSTAINVDLDWDQPTTVFILFNEEEVQPSLMEGIEIKNILRDGLSRLETVSTTYPHSEFRLKIVGRAMDGTRREVHVFSGHGWIGTGAGTARLADTQAFRLHKLICQIIANKRCEPTSPLRGFAAPA